MIKQALRIKWQYQSPQYIRVWTDYSQSLRIELATHVGHYKHEK